MDVVANAGMVGIVSTVSAIVLNSGGVIGIVDSTLPELETGTIVPSDHT